MSDRAPAVRAEETGTSADKELIEAYGREPVKMLRKNEDTVEARVRAIDDIDLLEAYLQVEIEREPRSRQAVVGAINRRLTTLRGE